MRIMESMHYQIEALFCVTFPNLKDTTPCRLSIHNAGKYSSLASTQPRKEGFACFFMLMEMDGLGPRLMFAFGT